MVTLAGLHQPDDEEPGKPKIVRQPGGNVTIRVIRGEGDSSDPMDRTCGSPLGLVGFGVASKSLLMAACRSAQPNPPFHADDPANRCFLPANRGFFAAITSPSCPLHHPRAVGFTTDEIAHNLASHEANELLFDPADDEIVMLDNQRIPAGKEKDPSGCKMKELVSRNGIVHLVLRASHPLHPAMLLLLSMHCSLPLVQPLSPRSSQQSP